MEVSNEESLSDDDTTDTDSIRQLQIALEVDQFSRRAPASAASSALTSLSINSTPDAATTARIETALAFNKLMDEKLQKLEKILAERLDKCRKKLEEVQGSQNEQDELLQKFKYIHCGKPYFKDNNSSTAPDNIDTIVMRKSGMYDTSNIISICGWTIKDKRFFTNTILTLSRQMIENKLQAELAKLQKEEPDNIAKIEEKMKSVEKQIAGLSKKGLNELALPLEEEYDWFMISCTLNKRHSPQEYRALWHHFLHPSINKNHWSKEEKKELRQVAWARNLQDWEQIARDLGTGRTGYQCFVYYRTNLENSMTGQKWTKEEEEYLKRLLEYYKHDNFVSWARIATKMPNRTKMQIYTKYMRMADKKGRFMKEEDEVLLTSVKKFGPDYNRITKILSGRSQSQLSRRYKLLMKSNRVSAVWTLDEDKRLLELMKDQDSSFNFANIVHLFPGKTRVNLRTRYMTLTAWMAKHPRLELAQAPRRGARRLGHGRAAPSLPGALESLKRRMEADGAALQQPGKKINNRSSETCIEDAIVTTLINEHISRTASQERSVEEARREQTALSIHDASDNVHRLLILLRAKLSRLRFSRSRHWPARYPGLLLRRTEDVIGARLVSYSKARRVHTMKLHETVDIWGDAPLHRSQRVLPPNAVTMAACRRLMAVASSGGGGGRSVAGMCHRNCLFRIEWERLLERFRLLFTWPLLLSNEHPSAQCRDLAPPTRHIELFQPPNVIIPPIPVRLFRNQAFQPVTTDEPQMEEDPSCHQ